MTPERWQEQWQRVYAGRWVERGGKLYPVQGEAPAPPGSPTSPDVARSERLKAALASPVLIALARQLGQRPP